MAENQYGFPTEVLSLPSQGLLYPEDSPLRSGTIDVKYMTAKEEDILTSTNLITQGKVIQRLLESDGNLTLLDQNKNITPNPYFRIFGTCNTLGAGDNSGLYHGTQSLNQGQLDRWNIFTTLNFMKPEVEAKVILNKIGKINKKIKNEIKNMVNLANLIRNSFTKSDISSIMSPRTSIIWAQNIIIFNNVELAFKLTFFNCFD